jgi:hypothetical protein
MAELNQLNLSNLEGVTPVITEEKQVSVTEETPSESLTLSNLEFVKPLQTQTVPKQFDLSNLEGVKTDYPSIAKQTDTTLSSEGPVVPDSQISNWERFEYGWDKETMVVGNMFRIGKAYFQDILDKDKTFKDYILENERKRLEALDKEHYKFRGREDDGGLITAGSVASMLLDPYYLVGYINPVSLKAMTNPISSATLNALLIGGDVVIDNIAKTGEVDWNSVAISSGTAGAIGAVIPIGGKVLSKYAPKLIKSELKLVEDFIEKKLAKQNNLTQPQLKKIKAAANTKEVKALSNDMVKWTTNFVRPIANETKKFKTLEKKLLEQRNLLIKIRKLKGRKQPKGDKVPGMLKQVPLGKQIINIRNKIIEAKKASELVKKDLIGKQQDKLKQWSELVAKRQTKILEALRKDETKIDWAVRGLLSATVRPLVGAGAGTVGGILFGDEETDLMYWAAAGAMAGQMQKMIQRSAKFGTNLEKGKILGLIDREMTQLTMQRVRDFMSATSASKLNSYGGATEKISKMLFREVDSPVQEKSVIAVAEQMQRYFNRKAYDITKNYSGAELAEANSILRGRQITKDTSERVITLSKNVRSYIDEFKNLSESAGFFPAKELDDYFPRVLNWDVVKKDEKAFVKTVKEIYESLGMKGTVASGVNKGKLRSQVAAENYLHGHRTSGDSVFNSAVLKQMFKDSKSGVSKEGNKFIYTPVTDHITHKRALQGPYKKVEQILENKGYLVNDTRNILNSLTNDSVKSIAFARQFGTNGELLQPLFLQIRNKYINSGLPREKYLNAMNQEMKLVANSIDAYFDRYGTAMTGASKSSAALLGTLGNLNMLGRVTITSLGDLIQPFQNSSSWRAIIRGFKDTALRAKNEKGLAKSLNQDIDDGIRQALMKSAGFEGRDALVNNAWVGMSPSQKVNNLAFQALGLSWLTGYARRFAYNTGVADAYYLSKTLNKLTKTGLDNTGRAKRIKYFLNNNYGISTNKALSIGSAKNLNTAIKIAGNKGAINEAGIITANRDALIPQVSNRLLFTQSNNQWVRLMGQFLSWAMAKSAQTNKILMRMENGSAKTLVKTLAVLPIYSGVQSLRELAKYGEVVTDYDANNNRWWAEGARLSGMFGFLPELIANRLIGPGSREPWYLFPPAAQIASAPVEAGKAAWDGNTDRAVRILSQRFLPLPNWRNWISKLFAGPKPPVFDSTLGSQIMFAEGGVIDRQNYLVGGATKLATKFAIKRGNTAINTTVGTYKKVNKILSDKKLNSVHDFGSGTGVGTKQFINKKVTSHEPFVPEEKIIKSGGKLPTYQTADDVLMNEGKNSKDAVVNLNVLNVIEDPFERANVVAQIGELINNKGVAIITTRGKDVATQASKSKNAIPHLDGWLFGAGSNKTFQKGFSQKELEEYVQEILGKLFKIEKIPSKYGIGTSGVMITKLSNSKNKIVSSISKDNLSNLKNQVTKIDSSLKRNSSTGVGKKIGGDLYVHKSSENVIPIITSAKAKLPKDYNYDVVKYNNKDKIVSFIKVPEFNTVNEPLATTGLKVFSDGTIKNININQIYHHKWLFVDDSYKGFNVGDSIERSLAWLPLRKNNKIKNFKWASIGRQEAWNKVIPFIPKLSVGGQVVRLGYEGGDEVLGLSELEGVKPLETKSVDDQVTTMMEEEKVIVPENKPEAADYMEIIKGYEKLGDKIIVDGVEKYKNYKGKGEEFVTSGFGNYNKNNKLEDSKTIDEANADLVAAINKRLPIIKKNIKDFNKFPLEVKQNLFSSWYRGSLSGSPETIKLINAGKYKEAAIEFLDNDEYRNAESLNRRGIIERMENTAKAIESLANQ